ncbi:unnamed protein product [Nippostrongylus brasiliensis]|uniref:Regulatory protein zeste n=1 Tax=Nippostrongylus brasiliensis TaxID=27835 RepID=A0A0N4Y3F4_NIPBR|nr:unnamed protein product [Nippostrongylus brasiliensis]
MKDRKKAPPFHECELKLLMRLYCESYEEYHGRGKDTGKYGAHPCDKKSLLRHFAQEVSNLGFYQRTEKQIEERLRADSKRVRKHERARSHQGAEAVLNGLPPYLHQLYECRRNRTNGSFFNSKYDDDYDHEMNDEESPSNRNKNEVPSRDRTPAYEEQTTSDLFLDIEDDAQDQPGPTTSPPPKKIPRKYTKRARVSESPDRRTLLYEEEIKLSMLRQQLTLEELKLIEQYAEELKLYSIKQELVRAQLEKEIVALERERLKLEREKKVRDATYQF